MYEKRSYLEIYNVYLYRYRYIVRYKYKWDQNDRTKPVWSILVPSRVQRGTYTSLVFEFLIEREIRQSSVPIRPCFISSRRNYFIRSKRKFVRPFRIYDTKDSRESLVETLAFKLLYRSLRNVVSFDSVANRDSSD